MKASRKYSILGACLVVIAAVSLFLYKVTSHSEAPAASTERQAAADNPEHELKELSMQLVMKPGVGVIIDAQLGNGNFCLREKMHEHGPGPVVQSPVGSFSN